MGPETSPKKPKDRPVGGCHGPIVDLIRMFCYVTLHLPCVVGHSGWVGGLMLRATRQLYPSYPITGFYMDTEYAWA